MLLAPEPLPLPGLQSALLALSPPGAPTTTSGTPSPFISPTAATAAPKPLALHAGAADVPPRPGVSLAVARTSPSPSRKRTKTQPTVITPSVPRHPGAPTARSLAPSPSTSPRFASAAPKRAWGWRLRAPGKGSAPSDGRRSWLEDTSPVDRRRRRYTAPADWPLVSSPLAPTATRSPPRCATALPKRMDPEYVFECCVPAARALAKGDPDAFRRVIWTAPAPPSEPGAPIMTPGKPSASRSPKPATLAPNSSFAARPGKPHLALSSACARAVPFA
mmetsp:Transcript_19107/g.56271  ORF Transcript_19107/g.56271 Transcript_19107/m.56271 type:complete len:276 (+) Transcript_19107:114-941(+)